MNAKAQPTQVMPFNQWLGANDDLVEKELREGEIECPECDGSGMIVFQDRSKDDHLFRQHMHEIYDVQRTSDLKKLSEWNRVMAEEAS